MKPQVTWPGYQMKFLVWRFKDAHPSCPKAKHGTFYDTLTHDFKATLMISKVFSLNIWKDCMSSWINIPALKYGPSYLFLFKWSPSSFLCLAALVASMQEAAWGRRALHACICASFRLRVCWDELQWLMFTASAVQRNKLWVKHKGIFFSNLGVDDKDCNAAVWLCKVSAYYEHA